MSRKMCIRDSLWKVPPIRLGPMLLGNMDVGINTQNLMALLLVVG